MAHQCEVISRRMGLNRRLREILIDSLALDLQPVEIADDAPLFGLGLGLDSIDALQFVAGVEAEFGVDFSDEDAYTYRSINTLSDRLLVLGAA